MNAKNLALAVGAALAPALADAATINVNSLGDAAVPVTDGNCTLREAIANANNDAATFPDCAAGSGADTITFSVSGTIVMAPAPAFEIMDSLTVDGPGPAALVIDATNGQGPFSTFEALGTFDHLTFDGITIRDGNRTAIRAQATTLTSFTLRNSVLTGNASGADGGGLYLYSVETATILDSVISGNTAPFSGGGIHALDVTALTIDRTEISGNFAPISGGGIVLEGSGVEIVNSTIANNGTTLGGGGGIALEDTSATIRLSTISGHRTNIAVGPGAELTLENTIVANAADNPNLDIRAPYTTVNATYSLIEDPTGATIVGTGNITGVDPQLGPLQNNGGSTRTMLPALTSPVIDAGDPAFTPPPSTDQRGFERPFARVDIGAVEISQAESDIPTLSQWMLLALAGALAGIAGIKLRD